ncbi:GNAT family N-acetyltransferase [Halomonas sp. SH5A2]|uniref:GNAT family N-acetyltransferase n=1 Tax=Halomonas sp. SH5A2 TaxID=2749040 RepID=UPI00163FB2B6|nr:GNAT family N-acetyltransferase [Halomonas sp. SH5A2]QNI03669.1 GNAT family N-acetyltransferase [Halomonas sp. SH5A2]
MITASERLGLRYHKPEDIAPIFNTYTGDLGSAKYLARQPHIDVAQTEQMLKKLSTPESLASNGMCIWVIEAIRYGTAAGLITVARDDASMAVHFGIGIPYRGRGYAAEALALTAQYLLATGQIADVTSFTEVENAAAQTALVKAGFVLTGRTENFYWAPQLRGESRDVFRYQFRP